MKILIYIFYKISINPTLTYLDIYLKMKIVALILISSFLVGVYSVIGISTYPYNPNYSTSSFKCILNSGYKDVVFTVLQSNTGIKT